ncbi:hypothetical protein [Streptomyces sp. NPDC003487]
MSVRQGRDDAAATRRGASRGPLARWLPALLAVLLAGGAATAAWSVPPVREVLLDSFTRRTSDAVELYFDQAPHLQGGTYRAKVTVDDHGSGSALLGLEAVLLDKDGKTLRSARYQLAPVPGAPSTTTVELRTRPGAATLQVRLRDHAQVIRYHL